MRRALGHAVEGFLTCAGCGAGPTLEDLGLTLTQDGHSRGGSACVARRAGASGTRAGCRTWGGQEIVEESQRDYGVRFACLYTLL